MTEVAFRPLPLRSMPAKSRLSTSVVSTKFAAMSKTQVDDCGEDDETHVSISASDEL